VGIGEHSGQSFQRPDMGGVGDAEQLRQTVRNRAAADAAATSIVSASGSL
jgi:hypothetical protein